MAVAAGYAVSLLVVGLVVAAQPAGTAQRWQQWASTNLDNLADHPVAALAVSAFVTDESGAVWAPVALVALWAAGRTLGARRAVALVAAVHVLATAVSEGLVWQRIRSGAEPASMRSLLDVGPSYVVVTALVAAVCYGGRRERIPAAAVFVVLAPSLFEGLDRGDVAAVGHCCSIVLGAGLGALVRRRESPRDCTGS